MRFFYIILIPAIFFLSISDGYAATYKGLRLSVSFDKDEYTQKDPINLTLKLENKGSREVYINKRFYINSEDSPNKYREIYFSVLSPSGEKLTYNEKAFRETGLPKTDYFILLKPGEEAGMERPRNIKYYFDFKDPGAYKIKAVYQNIYGEEIGVDAFKGELVSKPVTIKILE